MVFAKPPTMQDYQEILKDHYKNIARTTREDKQKIHKESLLILKKLKSA